ncbi:hypothetical protein [Rhodococcus sp. USK13]|uniref:hypothetical protein n=1 Tax=Rhodococcus sp. USK13 TaxID=2806442 RepID=UPI002016E4B8|nr:hypothetical protein [Rhodococcus sp. USK13]
MPIHGGARHLQHVRDLRDGVLARVVEALCEFDLVGLSFEGRPPYRRQHAVHGAALGGGSVALPICVNQRVAGPGV